ncbi:MAG: hypothetical protein LUF68_08385 [Clostridiales bacterium]|nr:hypothetical protein [Clostridiales bacterium]
MAYPFLSLAAPGIAPANARFLILFTFVLTEEWSFSAAVSARLSYYTGFYRRFQVFDAILFGRGCSYCGQCADNGVFFVRFVSGKVASPGGNVI